MVLPIRRRPEGLELVHQAGWGHDRIRPAPAVARLIGVVLATIPLLGGFPTMLWDDRRRCLEEGIARTMVVHAVLRRASSGSASAREAVTATGDPARRPPGAERPAEYRYGAVFVCVATALVFLVVAPPADWSRALALALEGLALLIAVATSRARREERRARAAVVGAAGVLLVLGVATGLVPTSAAAALSASTGIAASFALVGGLVGQVRQQGVTLQAVAGALAMYLQVGLIFAWIIGFVAHVDGAPYFEEGGDRTQSDRVYFSFTVLTTTGFGDLTAAEPVGRAIAVVEMLAGQLYLVTVIGVLVGGLVGRRKP